MFTYVYSSRSVNRTLSKICGTLMVIPLGLEANLKSSPFLSSWRRNGLSMRCLETLVEGQVACSWENGHRATSWGDVIAFNATDKIAAIDLDLTHASGNISIFSSTEFLETLQLASTQVFGDIKAGKTIAQAFCIFLLCTRNGLNLALGWLG